MAMKALMEYTNRERIRDVSNLTVFVEATSLGGQPKVMYVNNKNLAAMQKIKVCPWFGGAN